MSVESHKIDLRMFEEIRNVKKAIELLLTSEETFTREELFKKLFADPDFLSQAIVSETEKQEVFELALAGLDKTLLNKIIQ